MADAATLKSIKIKTGVLRRLIKEHSCYIKEVEKQAQRVEKLATDATNDEEAYRAKKEGEVLQESRAMVSDTARRCAIALADLEKLIADSNIEDCQEIQDAQEQIRLAADVKP